MIDKPENPPAFPESTFAKIGDVSEGRCNSGMTLRDYFAAAALQGLMAGETGCYGVMKELANATLPIEVAKTLYNIADAMLIVRTS